MEQLIDAVYALVTLAAWGIFALAGCYFLYLIVVFVTAVNDTWEPEPPKISRFRSGGNDQ